MNFTIRLAEMNISINSIYDEVYSLCRDYLTDDTPDFCIATEPSDIEFERQKNIQEALTEGIVPVDYTDSYLETLAVYRKIADKMPEFGTFLMHGAVIAEGEKAFLFTASSGTGKTTHIRLWLDNIAGSYVVNGDKPLIHIGDKVTVYGTPWAGKEGMQKNTGVELCGIVFLERGIDNSIVKIPLPQVLPLFIQQTYRPNDKQKLENILQLIRKLGSRVPLYRLKCNMQPDAAFTAYEALCAGTALKDNII